MTYRLSVPFLCVVTTLLLVPIPTRAQMDSREGIALQNQILELRRDLQNLREQAGRAGGAYVPPRGGSGSGSGEIAAQLLDRVSRLEEQMRALNGRQEELANRVQRLGEDVTKQIGDMNFRLQALEGGGRPGAAPPAMTPPPRNLAQRHRMPPRQAAPLADHRHACNALRKP